MNKLLKAEFAAFFDFFKKALLRFQDLIEKDKKFLDDIVFLICIYIDALAVFKYGGGRKGFIDFIQRYSNDHCRIYLKKISLWFLEHPLLNKNGKIIKLKKIKQGTIKKKESYPREIYKKLGYAPGEYKFENDLHIDEALAKIKYIISCDEINKFSLAGYFYSYYRCFGVHNAQLLHGWIGLRGREPFFMVSSKIWEIVFPIDFIFEIFESCISNFEKEIKNYLLSKKYNHKNKYIFSKKEFKIRNAFIENYVSFDKKSFYLSKFK